MKNIMKNIEQNEILLQKQNHFKSLQQDYIRNVWHETILQKDTQNQKKRTQIINQTNRNFQGEKLHEMRKQQLRILLEKENQMQVQKLQKRTQGQEFVNQK